MSRLAPLLALVGLVLIVSCTDSVAEVIWIPPSGSSGPGPGGGGTAGGLGDSSTGAGPSDLPLGSSCTAHEECSSGHCSDEVCCDTSCNGTCESCRGDDTCLTDGACAPIVSGTDPSLECDDGSCFQGACAQGSLAFVTSTLHTGDLGGLSGADAICQNLAEAQCLPGNYLAWLGSDTAPPAMRFSHQSVPYRFVNGGELASDWSDLTDGNLDTVFDVDERGNPAPMSDVACGMTNLVYASTMTDGTFDLPGGSLGDCANWTTTWMSGEYSTFGSRGVVDDGWVLACPGVPGYGCSLQAPLMCFQQ